MTIDVDAYCARIEYGGDRTASLEVLRVLHALHPAAIPFENLDPFLGRRVSLDLAAIQAKLVEDRRGGYCFEHNMLFRAVLVALGFAVTPLSARVVWMAAPDAPLGPRTHMLLKVDIADRSYIADVGFGGQLVSAPLELAPGLEQPTAQAVMRLAEEGNALRLQTLLPTGWASLYRFTLEPAEQSDYVLSNWFTSTYPGHLLTSNLIVQRLAPETRTSLFNTRLTRRFPDGRAETVELPSPEALDRALVEEFGLPSLEDAARVFAKLPVAQM